MYKVDIQRYVSICCCSLSFFFNFCSVPLLELNFVCLFELGFGYKFKINVTYNYYDYDNTYKKKMYVVFEFFSFNLIKLVFRLKFFCVVLLYLASGYCFFFTICSILVFNPIYFSSFFKRNFFHTLNNSKNKNLFASNIINKKLASGT